MKSVERLTRRWILRIVEVLLAVDMVLVEGVHPALVQVGKVIVALTPAPLFAESLLETPQEIRPRAALEVSLLVLLGQVTSVGPLQTVFNLGMKVKVIQRSCWLKVRV